MPSTRREFISTASKAVAATAITSNSLLASTKKWSPNEKIVVALIGAKNMGFGDLENALKQPNVECAALCDVDQDVLNQRTADVVKMQGKAPAQYKDFRKVLENKDIDAVIIGTPDHWHCLPFVYACEAGKDVYVEKPLANSIAECEVMVKATRKYNRVVQVGQQQRSGRHFIDAMNIIKQGKIGQLRKVNVWGNFNYGIGSLKVQDSVPPPTVDFNMWLGSAPQRSFNTSRFHGNWRMFWDYGGGLLTDWGVHLLDVALWAKDIKTLPQSVFATGGNFSFPDHAHETFDTMSVQFQMPDYNITWEHTAGTQNGPYNSSYGLAFIGNNGTLFINRETYQLFPEWDEENKKPKTQAIPATPGDDSHEDHMKNFLACIKSRNETNCPIENGRLVAMYAHMGNIALRTNKRVVWNDAAKNFGDNNAANALITPHYRAPWQLPVI